MNNRLTLRASAHYFSLVFAAGFVFGAIREFFVAPRFGANAAELVEMPLMLIIITIVARRIVRRDKLDIATALCSGLLSLALMLTVEFSTVAALRGLSWQDYFGTRDSLVVTAYLLSLIYFALLPAWLAYRQMRRDNSQSHY